MKQLESYVRTLKTSDAWLTDEAAWLDPTSSPEARVRLRRLVIASDAASEQELRLALIWRELVHGTCRVVDEFVSADRCYVVLSSTPDPRPIEGRRLEILEAVLRGAGQKNIAIDLGLAPSTIALNARLALQHLGVVCRPSRVNPLLMLAARVGARQDGVPSVSLSWLSCETGSLRVISIVRPDRQLFRVLPPAELAVIRHLVEGLPYEEIAKQRGTSTRTIANQITAVFRRMRVSGRSELLSRLFFSGGLEREAQPRSRSIATAGNTPLGAPSAALCSA